VLECELSCVRLCVCSEDKLLQDEVINIMPLVQNVNAMAEEMQKPVAFSMLLVSPEARGLERGRTEVSYAERTVRKLIFTTDIEWAFSVWDDWVALWALQWIGEGTIEETVYSVTAPTWRYVLWQSSTAEKWRLEKLYLHSRWETGVANDKRWWWSRGRWLV